MFCDPFIYHALRAWIDPVSDPYGQQIKPLASHLQQYANLVEACAITYFRRFYPTYYIKAEGEVDVAYVKNKKMWPVEVKWTSQLRRQDLKQIMKYKNDVIFSKIKTFTSINHLTNLPLPWGVFKIDG